MPGLARLCKCATQLAVIPAAVAFLVAPSVASAAAPTVITQEASGIGAENATLAGTLDTNSAATTYQFEYGPTTAYGSTTPLTSAAASATHIPAIVSVSVGGLLPSTTYHYRIGASNASGSVVGADKTFTTSATASNPSVLLNEQVATGASYGQEGENTWGGNQNRIVKTPAGTFVVWTSFGRDTEHKTWHLMWRRNGVWSQVATGPSGREPAHVLANRAGRVIVHAWEPTTTNTSDAAGRPTIWSGVPNTTNGTLTLTKEVVSGNWYLTGHNYSGAGEGADGAIYVTESLGDTGLSREIRWARRDPITGTWSFHVLSTPDGRYGYVRVVPDETGPGVSFVGVRNMRWQDISPYNPGTTYLFDGADMWRTTDSSVANPTFVRTTVAYEAPTAAYPSVEARPMDAMVDKAGRMHVLYFKRGQSTGGAVVYRHAVVGTNGAILDDKGYSSTDEWAKFAMNARGNVFVVDRATSNSPNFRLWPNPDPATATLGAPTTLSAGVNIPTGGVTSTAGILPASPRAGIPPYDHFEFVFVTNDASGKPSVMRFTRVQLPSG